MKNTWKLITGDTEVRIHEIEFHHDEIHRLWFATHDGRVVELVQSQLVRTRSWDAGERHEFLRDTLQPETVYRLEWKLNSEGHLACGLRPLNGDLIEINTTSIVYFLICCDLIPTTHYGNEGKFVIIKPGEVEMCNEADEPFLQEGEVTVKVDTDGHRSFESQGARYAFNERAWQDLVSQEAVRKA